jgi:hypothetical protein
MTNVVPPQAPAVLSKIDTSASATLTTATARSRVRPRPHQCMGRTDYPLWHDAERLRGMGDPLAVAAYSGEDELSLVRAVFEQERQTTQAALEELRVRNGGSLPPSGTFLPPPKRSC